MTWAGKRRLFYFGIVFFVAVLFAGYLLYPILTTPPTCSDGKKNGDERGPDCGGVCSLVCNADAVDLLVLWSRSFEVIPGVYNSVAYIENQNPTAGIKKISYEFKLYDTDNKFIANKKGSTFISPAGKTAIFESNINTGINRIPKRTTFTFTENPVWNKASEDASNFSFLKKDIISDGLDSSPHISAVIENDSLRYVPEFDVVVLVYDSLGNAIGASKTFVEGMNPSAKQSVNFTWPKPFSVELRTIEIVPRVNVFKLNF
jgi:hypothetical protein